MNNIKAVFFDFDNTIVDYFKSDTIGLKSVLELLPTKLDLYKFSDISVEKIYEFDALVNSGKEIPSNIHRYRLNETLKHFQIKWEERYLEAYLKNYIESTSCFPGIEEVIKYLYGKVKLGMLTNSYDSVEQRKRIESTGLLHYFKDMVISSEIGAYKPDKEAFLYLVDKYDLEPSSCLFIGDSEEHDIKGAKNAGLYAIKILHNKKSRSDTVADCICQDFNELLSLLKGLDFKS